MLVYRGSVSKQYELEHLDTKRVEIVLNYLGFKPSFERAELESSKAWLGSAPLYFSN